MPTSRKASHGCICQNQFKEKLGQERAVRLQDSTSEMPGFLGVSCENVSAGKFSGYIGCRYCNIWFHCCGRFLVLASSVSWPWIEDRWPQGGRQEVGPHFLGACLGGIAPVPARRRAGPNAACYVSSSASFQETLLTGKGTEVKSLCKFKVRVSNIGAQERFLNHFFSISFFLSLLEAFS